MADSVAVTTTLSNSTGLPVRLCTVIVTAIAGPEISPGLVACAWIPLIEARLTSSPDDTEAVFFTSTDLAGEGVPA